VILLYTRHNFILTPYRSRGVVFLKDQYKGLKEAEGMIYPKPIAISVSSLEVEKRSLGVYQSLLEVDRI